MSTDTQAAEKANGSGTAVAIHEPNEGGAISAFASEGNFVSAQRMAKALQASTLTPTEYRGNISNVLIAMELASRIGCSVLMVMQNMSPIQGKPAWSSTFLIASVNASKRFTSLRFRWQGEEGSDSWGCRAVARDTDTDEECLGSLITIAMAKAEGWYQKKGSKWQTMPEQMLMYRSATFWTRVYCPEIAMGIRPVDELEDMGYGGIGTPAPSSAAAELEEALRSASSVEPRVIEGEVIDEGDQSEVEVETGLKAASTASIEELRALIGKARSAGVMDLELEAVAETAIEAALDAGVVDAKKKVSLALLAAAQEEEG
jgi:hypothetical protein